MSLSPPDASVRWSLTLRLTHTVWLKPSNQIRSPVFSIKQRALRRSIIIRYSILYGCVFAFFAALIVIPLVFSHSITLSCSICDQI